MVTIEVIFLDRIGNYYTGQVAEIEEGIFLRSLLLGNKVEVLNPPDWDPEAYLKEGNGYGIKSNFEQSANGETPERPHTRKGPRKTSPKSSEEAPGNSTEGHRGPSEFFEDRNENGAG